MKEIIPPQPRPERKPRPGVELPVAQKHEKGTNGTRVNLNQILSPEELSTPKCPLVSMAEVNSARAFLLQNLTEENFKRVQDACSGNSARFLLFRDLLINKNPTTMGCLLDAADVYSGNDEVFRIFEELARIGIITKDGDVGSEQEIQRRAMASNALIFFKKTVPFHNGDPEILGCLAEIAKKIDVGRFLQDLRGDSRSAPGNIRLVCIRAALEAKMLDAESKLVRWASGSKRTPSRR